MPPPGIIAPKAAARPIEPRDKGRSSPKALPNHFPSSDSSADAIPIAEPIEIHTAQPPGRWAEPIEAAEPLPEAEVVYDVATEPAHPADDLFAAGGAYGDPLDIPGDLAAPIRSLPTAHVPAPKKRRRTRAGDKGEMNVTDWIAYFVLFALLPMSGLFFLLGLVQFFRLGRLAPPAAKNDPHEIFREHTAAQNALMDDYIRNKRARHSARREAERVTAPPAASYAITILRATKKATSDDFSMEYEVGRQTLNPASQYIWVVSSPRGKIEFQIPTPSAQARGQISGRPAQPAGLAPPFTAYIEEQAGGARTRVSNQANVVVGG